MLLPEPTNLAQHPGQYLDCDGKVSEAHVGEIVYLMHPTDRGSVSIRRGVVRSIELRNGEMYYGVYEAAAHRTWQNLRWGSWAGQECSVFVTAKQLRSTGPFRVMKKDIVLARAAFAYPLGSKTYYVLQPSRDGQTEAAWVTGGVQLTYDSRTD
jgi:hypothetical protein